MQIVKYLKHVKYFKPSLIKKDINIKNTKKQYILLKVMDIISFLILLIIGICNMENINSKIRRTTYRSLNVAAKKKNLDCPNQPGIKIQYNITE